MVAETGSVTEEDPACDRCGKPAGPDAQDITWSQAWREWLCSICRDLATYAELRMTLEEKRALDSRAAEAS